MSLLRFYCSKINKGSVELTGSEAHHMSSVRRLKKADRVELFNGAGSLAIATIVTATDKKVTLQVETLKSVSKPGRPSITLGVSVPKGGRFDWLIAKCTELGVDRICPVLFERTVKHPKNAKAGERWKNIAIASAKQCRRLFLPQINQPLLLPRVLEVLASDFPDAAILFGSLSQRARPILEEPFTENGVIALVGPEGGLTDDELDLLREHDARAVRITDTILRIETAAVAFAAVLCAKREAQRE